MSKKGMKDDSNIPEFRNNSSLTFSDLSSEVSHTYVFSGKQEVTIDRPLKLNVSASGGHRIFDAQGFCHYIPPTWIHLRWEVYCDKPHFDF